MITVEDFCKKLIDKFSAFDFKYINYELVYNDLFVVVNEFFHAYALDDGSEIIFNIQNKVADILFGNMKKKDEFAVEISQFITTEAKSVYVVFKTASFEVNIREDLQLMNVEAFSYNRKKPDAYIHFKDFGVSKRAIKLFKEIDENGDMLNIVLSREHDEIFIRAWLYLLLHTDEEKSIYDRLMGVYSRLSSEGNTLPAPQEKGNAYDYAKTAVGVKGILEYLM